MPKSKYKSEVEKLIEMQAGLEPAASKRGDTVALVEGQETNQCESNETDKRGDGPKTGIAE
jgi:hypothetical protein